MDPVPSTAPPAPPAPPRGRLARWAGIAAVPALIGAFIGLGGPDLLIPDDPYVEAAESAGQRMLDLPGFEARFGEIEDREEAFEAGAQIALEGIPRLPDADLDTWLAITRELVAAVDVDDCAAIVRGPDASTDFVEIFKKIDLDDFRRYIDLVVKGAQLAISDAGSAPIPSQADVDAALGQLLGALGPDRLQQIGTTLSSPANASDAELCSALRDTYDAIAGLDEDARYTLIRMMLGVARSAWIVPPAVAAGRLG